MKNSTQGGYILIFDEINRSYQIADRVESNLPFSEGLSTDDFKPKSKELFLISFDGEKISTICLGTKKKKVLTLKHKVEFTDYVQLEPPLEISQIVADIDKNLRKHFIKSTSGNGSKVPPKTWGAVLSYLVEKRPEVDDKVKFLIEKRNRGSYSGKSEQVEILKRDATNVALRIANIDVGKADFILHSQEQEIPPFLDGLYSLNLMEDRILQHDSQIFSHWHKLEDINPSITAQFRQGNKTLTIQNYNRDKVEHILGVDLLYYHHYYQSYVLVQYKKLESTNGQKFYRIGEKSYQKELEKMSFVEDKLSSIKPLSQDLIDYRYHTGLCYFKLCEPKILDFNDTSMVQGMYIPLDYWKVLLNSKSTVGDRGGKLIGYNNVERYFNNTQFIDLVKDGWIGSNAIQSKILSEIIKHSLEEGRSVVLAEYFDETNDY